MKVIHDGQLYELPYHDEEEFAQEQEIDPDSEILAAEYSMELCKVWKKFKVKDIQPVL